MVVERALQDDVFWATENPAGTASTASFDGADGLERLSGPWTFTAPVADLFHARVTRVVLSHIVLQGFAATAHRSTRTRRHIAAHPAAALTFVFIKSGVLGVQLDDASFEVGPGQFFILDSRDPVTFTVGSELRALTSMIDIEHMPSHLRSRGTTIPKPLQHTPLVDSFIAFQATILSSTMAGRRVQGDELVRAVAELHAAVLAEAQKLASEPTGVAALRHRMEEHIEAHLADPGLRPESVAEAVGISLRHAHNVFNDGERTIARHIRDRRLEIVAFTLRTSSERVPLADLALQHGFTSPEAMSRAFSDRYGASPADYRSRHHAS